MHFREKARATLVAFLGFAATVSTLMGCQTTPDTPAPAQPAVVAESPRPYHDPAKVLGVLDDAQTAMQRQQFTYPAQGSALGLFDTVLAMDPDNAEAQRGIERIMEYYLEMAEVAAQRNQPARAQSMLDRARLVKADHPAVARSATQIELLANAKRDRLMLDRTHLRKRSAKLGQPLKALGIQARDLSCRTMIRVRNDSEGRWVYQQMNLAPGEIRIRAQIQIGSPPLVELVCFQES